MKFKNYHIIGFIFTFVLGSLLHFTYEMSNQNRLVGYFSAINESTWEHLKLLITPSIIFYTYEFFLYGKNINNFIFIKALSILLGMFIIIASFYTYTGIIGKNYLILDIFTFIIGAFSSFYFSYKMLNKNFYIENSNFIGFFIIFIIIFFTIYFTESPPKINLFLDPVTNTYGTNLK